MLFINRSEIQKYEQMIEDYKSQLRVHDSIPTRDHGFQPYADGHNSFHVHTINQLSRYYIIISHIISKSLAS